jgi:methylated-DNA-[protein]-cysteine S-methyltransferase
MNRLRIAECGMKSNVFKTPLGWVGVAVSDQGICRIVPPRKEKQAAEKELKGDEFAACAQRLRVDRSLLLRKRGHKRVQGVRSSEMGAQNISRVLAKAVKLLQQYFSGERVSFDLPLDLRYYTAFQQAVWKASAEIPCGETRSYAWIAKKIKKPLAMRAVGQALGANPVPVIIPVTGSSARPAHSEDIPAGPG